MFFGVAAHSDRVEKEWSLFVFVADLRFGSYSWVVQLGRPYI